MDSFAPFPRLPIELRLPIWREAFPPPRCINLDYNTVFCTKKYQESVRRHNRKQVKFPTTLHVNRESRAETLKHYFIITGPPCSGTLAMLLSDETIWLDGESLLCLDPRRDHLYINFHSLAMLQACNQFHQWISHLASEFPECINTIQALEVREAYHRLYNPEFFKVQYEDPAEVFASAVMLLPGLKKLCVTTERHFEANLHPGRPHWKVFEREFAKFLQSHKDDFADGKAPELTFRKYKQLRS